MAGPGDELAAGYGPMRASHADRERVIGILKVAFTQGRLDRDEFGQRAGQALAARTYADLDALTADIPTWLVGARPAEAVAKQTVNKKTVKTVAWATVAFIAFWPVMAGMSDNSPFVFPVIIVFLFLFLAVPTGWLVVLHDWLDKRAARQSCPALPPVPGEDVSTDR